MKFKEDRNSIEMRFSYPMYFVCYTICGLSVTVLDDHNPYKLLTLTPALFMFLYDFMIIPKVLDILYENSNRD